MKNRKKISIIFAVLILGTININTVFGATGTITTETIRIREKASTDSKILDMGSLNEKVEILGEEDGWYKVKYKETTGYIYKNYLKPDEEITNPVQTTEPSVEPTNTASPEPSTEPVQEPEQINTQVTEPTQNNVEKKLGNATNRQTDTYLTPNFSSIKISKIEKGITVEILTTLANWSKVKVNNEEGWIPNIVLMEEVETKPEETKTENQPEEKPEESQDPVEQPVENPEKPQETGTQINQQGYISSNAQANLRSGPSTNTESIGKLKRHTVITVISEENDWYKVTYNGKEGYISKSLVTIGEVPEETSSRSADTSRAQALSNNSSDIVSVATQYLGNKYVSGGTSPETGFDCSGFTQYVYGKCGISLSRASSTQANNGTPVEKSELQPGDLLLFHYYGEDSIGHVGIYTGNGQFIHAANAKRGVVYDTINSGYYADNYAGARRF